MSEPEDYFAEELSRALAACAKARELVPPEWDEETQDEVQHQITVAMGLLQPLGMSFCVLKDPETLRWEAWCHAVDDGSAEWETGCKKAARATSTAMRLTGYALFGQVLLKRVQKLLSSPDAERHEHKLSAQFGKRLSSGQRALQEVLDVVGDDGVYSWL